MELDLELPSKLHLHKELLLRLNAALNLKNLKTLLDSLNSLPVLNLFFQSISLQKSGKNTKMLKISMVSHSKLLSSLDAKTLSQVLEFMLAVTTLTIPLLISWTRSLSLIMVLSNTSKKSLWTAQNSMLLLSLRLTER